MRTASSRFVTGELEQLRDLVARSAGDALGQIDSGYPGLCFFRASGCTPVMKRSAPGMFLACILEGAKRMRFGDLELVYTPGEYLVVTGETDYEGQVSRGPYLSLSLDLPPELVVETLAALSDAESAGGEIPSACVSEVEPELIDALCRLVGALDDPAEQTVLAPLAVRELVFRLLRSEWAGLLRRAAYGSGNEDQKRIRDAIAFIQKNHAKRLTVELIARQVRMSPSHFAHRFRDLTRTSPMRYVKQVRLQRARDLIVRDGARVGEAAEQVGYQSTSHFTRDFKGHFGAAPGTYARASQDRADQSQDPALAGTTGARRVRA